jgi:hypothetical protein
MHHWFVVYIFQIRAIFVLIRIKEKKEKDNGNVIMAYAIVILMCWPSMKILVLIINPKAFKVYSHH